ncbi:MAG: PQQ-dependent sugar dehydrogenase [Candidatus Eremiobacteraeota bacterium]|nr:PQQ-dependent sugar dehydrogenase [Candidatus Eremiobacteraeota bacterium]
MLKKLLLGLLLSAVARAQPDLRQIQVPSGFKLELYARVPGARHLGMAPDGTLFVGTTGSKVYAVTPQRKVHEIASGLNSPNGVAFADGTLYICEIQRLSRVRNILSRLDKKPPLETLNSQLPDKTHHGYRVLRWGPDRRLYIGIGAPLNVGEVADPFGTLSRFSQDFKKLEVLQRGIRNTMGFDWDPQDGCLWFSDNGRDMLGDDIPPEELNRAPKSNQHYGFPYRYGNNLPDPEWGSKMPARLHPVAPASALQAHMAPLGLRFYRGKMFPATYRNCIFLATHGSWNRSSPVGYCLMLGRPDNQGKARTEVFAQGWLRGRQVSGRPVDVQEMPDGALVISDDYAGCLYRLSYGK